jgi:hypothetical protein
MGLFTADQNLRGRTARFTRQNPGGTRRGYECPEERDYYPYWHPTPWTDIAVFTNDVSRCDYYQAESQNVKSRWACIIPSGLHKKNARTNKPVIPNNREDCEEVTYTVGNTTQRGVWTEFSPKEGLSPPECIDTLWSRDNHLGNGMGGNPNHYNWTIPNLPHEHCVFRARYNISTAEYNAWDGSVNSSLNRMRGKSYSELDVWSQFDLSKEEAIEREYLFENNPQVQIFDTVDGINVGSKLALQLAINTNQFGRTFQDRSHSFAIREKPASVENCRIHNLNVRGKRGNIVQVFPGVEYDFVPETLVMGTGDCIHIQWTGSNTNPNNNDGQGRAGTDRSNIVLLRKQNYPEGIPGMAVPLHLKHGHLGNSHPAHLNENITFLGLPRADRQSIAVLDTTQLGGEMSELDDAGTYFDLGLRTITQAGTYYYMCSRNNNFSNRSQKGKIIVLPNSIATGRLGITGGYIDIEGETVVEVQPGAFAQASTVTVEQFTHATAQDMNLVTNVDNVVTDVVRMRKDGDGMVTIRLKDNSNLAYGARKMLVAAREGADFVEIESTYENNHIVAQTDRDGIFLATSPGIGLLVGFVVAFLIIIALIIVIVIIYCVYRRRTVKKKYTGCVAFKNKFKRSLQSKV